MGVIALLGYISLLLSRQVSVPDLWSKSVPNSRRFTLPVILGVVFGLVQIGLVIVQKIRVPMVPFPLSLPVYITVGILSELIFHFIPLVGLMFSISLVLGEGKSRQIAVLVGVILISLWEPVLQIMMMLRMDIIPNLIAGILPFLLVRVANLLPLLLLKKYGLLAAVSWRLADYLVWHIVWGAMDPSLYATLGM